MGPPDSTLSGGPVFGVHHILPPTFERFLALPRDTFDTAEELLDAGWAVD